MTEMKIELQLCTLDGNVFYTGDADDFCSAASVGFKRLGQLYETTSPDQFDSVAVQVLQTLSVPGRPELTKSTSVGYLTWNLKSKIKGHKD